jgi:protein-S-isoprenylcysteine O-methyltransferase Ste14
MQAIAPLACLAFLGLVGIGGRIWLHRRRTGTWGVVLFRSATWSGHLREALVVALPVALAIEALLAAFAPESLAWLGTIPGLAAADTWAIGAGLMLAATLLMAAAQAAMGSSWRIGIEEGARPGLVTGGPYRLSRNPIYVCLLLALAGFALTLPNWLSFGLFAAAALGIRIQVGKEEHYLLETYGEAYRAYARRVGRFVPGLGRLR